MNKKIISAIIIGTMALATTSGCSEANTAISISDTLSAAERYLSEMKYEQAIIEFDKILSVEPKNVDAYLGKAVAYIALGDTDSAIKTLQTGYEQTEDERLKQRIDELSAPAETTSTETTMVETAATSETTTTPETTPYEETTYSEEETSKPIEEQFERPCYFGEYNAPLTVDDPHCLEVEQMILNAMANGMPVDPTAVDDVTGILVYGAECVSVRCGDRMGHWYREDYLSIDPDGYTDLKDDEFVIYSTSSSELRYKDAHWDIHKWGKNVDLSFLKSFNNLEAFAIAITDISDISVLSELTKLRYFHTWFCKIEDISPLSDLQELETIMLNGYRNYRGQNYNQIEDVSPLKNLKNLKYLELDDNLTETEINALRSYIPDCYIKS